MKTRIFSVLVLACMLLSLLTACGSGKGDAITAEEAQQIVLEHAGVTEKEVSDVHTHIATNDAGEACYSIHVTINGQSYEYLIHGKTGEVLSHGEGGH